MIAPKSFPIQSGSFLVFVESPVVIPRGDFFRAFIFYYHLAYGPVVPSNVSVAIYSGSTVLNANPIATPNLVQLGNGKLGSYVLEFTIPQGTMPGLYTLVFSASYNSTPIQISFPVLVI